MVISKSLEIEGFILILIGAAVGSFFLFQPKISPTQTNQPIQFPVNVAEVVEPTATPTIVFTPKTSVESQISSDGTKKVEMKITENKDSTRTYDVSTGDGGPVIFSKTLPQGSSLNIPFNTWDPQNNYFFIQEKNENGQIVRVFKDSGESFAEEEPFLDLTDVFGQKADITKFTEATGWGGYNLIVINTKLEDNTQGYSYWFEVPSKALIPLSTKF